MGINLQNQNFRRLECFPLTDTTVKDGYKGCSYGTGGDSSDSGGGDTGQGGSNRGEAYQGTD